MQLLSPPHPVECNEFVHHQLMESFLHMTPTTTSTAGDINTETNSCSGSYSLEDKIMEPCCQLQLKIASYDCSATESNHARRKKGESEYTASMPSGWPLGSSPPGLLSSRCDAPHITTNIDLEDDPYYPLTFGLDHEENEEDQPQDDDDEPLRESLFRTGWTSSAVNCCDNIPKNEEQTVNPHDIRFLHSAVNSGGEDAPLLLFEVVEIREGEFNFNDDEDEDDDDENGSSFPHNAAHQRYQVKMLSPVHHYGSTTTAPPHVNSAQNIPRRSSGTFSAGLRDDGSNTNLRLAQLPIFHLSPHLPMLNMNIQKSALKSFKQQQLFEFQTRMALEAKYKSGTDQNIAVKLLLQEAHRLHRRQHSLLYHDATNKELDDWYTYNEEENHNGVLLIHEKDPEFHPSICTNQVLSTLHLPMDNFVGKTNSETKRMNTCFVGKDDNEENNLRAALFLKQRNGYNTSQMWHGIELQVERDLKSEEFSFVQRKVSCMCIFDPDSGVRVYADCNEDRTDRIHRQKEILFEIRRQKASGRGNGYFLL